MDGFGGGQANATAMAQMAQTDALNAQTIQTQMQADVQKQQWRRIQIMMDTQTKIMEIQQEIAVNKAKTGDKMFLKWDEYIKA